MMWIYLYINDGLSRRRGSLRIWMENAPHLHGWGGPPNSCEEAWGKCAHMGEAFREGRIRTAVHGRLADITELKAPDDARSGNKKRLRPQGNAHRLAES
jgi:hypothetical protein